MWEMNQKNNPRDNFRAGERYDFLHRNYCQQHWKFDQSTPGFFIEEFECSKMVVLCSKTYCCFDEPSGITKLSCRRPNRNETH